MKFELHTVESAPQVARSELETVQNAFGSIFNLYRGLANAPATLKVHLACNQLLK